MIMWKKRLLVCMACGAVIGVFCIIGALVRFQFEKDFIYLFSLWYNRLLMGIVIGLFPVHKSLPSAIVRGAVMGLVVSFAFFATTGFADYVSFGTGVVCGIIIESVAFRVSMPRAEAPEA
jgi:hypothetical protein